MIQKFCRLVYKTSCVHFCKFLNMKSLPFPTGADDKRVYYHKTGSYGNRYRHQGDRNVAKHHVAIGYEVEEVKTIPLLLTVTRVKVCHCASSEKEK